MIIDARIASDLGTVNAAYVVIEENGHVMSRHLTLAGAERAHDVIQTTCRRNGYSSHPCRVQRVAVGRVKRVAAGWQAWVFDAAGAADWGTYATRDAARDAARRGVAKS